MSENKVAILCTRVIDEAWVKEAASKNISVDIIPFIRTEPISSIETQQEIEQALMLSAEVVFTSVNAVEAVLAELEGHRPDWRIFCIGHATRQAAEKYFGKDLIAGAADNAEELAKLIVEKSDRDEVLFFCGDQRREELPALLKENNIAVNEIVVYQTIDLSHKIEKKYDGVLFFSPSAARSFFQKNKIGDHPVLFAIGFTTASEIKNYSNNKILISDQPDKNSMLEKLITYYEANRVHP